MSAVAKAANYYAGFSIPTFGQGNFAKVAGFAKACLQAIGNFGILTYNLARFQQSNRFINWSINGDIDLNLQLAGTSYVAKAELSNDGMSEADMAYAISMFAKPVRQA